VDEEAMGDDRGRIQIVVEYEMKSSPSSGFAKDHHHQQQQQQSDKDAAGQSSPYQSVENRITAHVDIQRDNTYAIVPVVKVR
jgi:hypothetical protein